MSDPIPPPGITPPLPPVLLSPFAGAGQQFFDNNGNVLSGGKIYTYAAGTTTPATTYTSNLGVASNPNPIILDSAGRLPSQVWLTANVTYKFVLRTSADVLLGTYDNVPGINDLASLYANTGAALVGAQDGAGGSRWANVQQFISLFLSSQGASIVNYSEGSTGAATRTVQSRLRETLSPEDFGAVGDGVLDDTGAFFNALIAAQGRVLRLSPGKTYLLSTWSAYAPAQPVIIQGNGAIIRGPTTAATFLSPLANVSIQDCVFDRWSSVVKRSLAQTGTFTKFRFVNNSVINCTGLTIDIERPIYGFWITDNIWDSCSGGYAIRIGDNTEVSNGVYIRGTVSRNTFASLTASGTTSCAAMLVYARDVTIEGNIIDGVQSDAGEAWGIYSKTGFSTIRGNIIRNVNSTSNPDVVGLNIKGTRRQVPSPSQLYNVIVTDNNIYNIGTAAVRGSCIRLQKDDTICSNNICENGGLFGIVTDDSAGANDQIISNNKVWFDSSTGRTGIAVDCNGSRIIVAENDVKGASVGIRVFPVGGTLTSARVSDNTINAVDAGIGLTPNDDIIRLSVAGNVVDGGGIGIVRNAGAGDIVELEVLDNDLSRCTNMFLGDFKFKRLRQECYGQTTSATVLSIFGVSLEDESAHSIEIKLVGNKDDSSDRAMYWKRALVYRDGGNATIQGSVQAVTADVESAGGWDGTLIVDAATVQARATGAAATTVNWSGEVSMLGV